ncbi:metalloregulator ArsR/SmtB family transcription factor [Phycicoccus sp. MAQZ13P-2]|uniref:ArsR/SmtB family transcription factor n=1 Tax=Phycicoccus mangrovi TaxID=2840470 RepID=UPI001C004BEF|nr:metalloregulator ArsR/SmtB family transcription factor [Phycicoccus mangrovi]MBT9258047.1 metalloregulator ArsR/SmtB family transcription factor [Phycicoccus mangrovi]MBT9276258.1 metalloregulator ArsR/SmtB family transcription factor [Phycicoccus mangrovi]
MSTEVTARTSVLRALADPVRARVVEELAAGPQPAGELARRVGVSAPTMSKHLRTLLAAGLVVDARGEGDARLRVFRLDGGPVEEVRTWLDRVQAGWDEQLAAYRRHVELRTTTGADG